MKPYRYDLVSFPVLFRTNRLYTKPLEAVFTFLSRPSTLFLTSYRVKEAVYSTSCGNKNQTPSIWDTICMWGRKSSKLNLSRGTTAVADEILPVHCLARCPVEYRHQVAAKHITAKLQTNHQTFAIKPKQWVRPETQRPVHSCSLDDKSVSRTCCIAAPIKQTRARWRLRELHMCHRYINTLKCLMWTAFKVITHSIETSVFLLIGKWMAVLLSGLYKGHIVLVSSTNLKTTWILQL